jgi:hypothetical protein
MLTVLLNKKAPLHGGGWEQGKSLCLMRGSQGRVVRILVTAFSGLSIVCYISLPIRSVRK